MTLYAVEFYHRCKGYLVDSFELHHGVCAPDVQFWKDVKKLAEHSPDNSVRSWASRGPCDQLPLCRTIKVWRMAVDSLTRESAKCKLVKSVSI